MDHSVALTRRTHTETIATFSASHTLSNGYFSHRGCWDSPAPREGPFWHTHCTWKDACKPLHAFEVPVYQCGLILEHTQVSY